MAKSEKLLITGSRGFVGRNLLPLLRNEGFQIRELNRADVGGSWDGATDFSMLDLRCDTLIHLAARVHVMNEPESAATLELYRQANVAAFRNLVQAGVKQGVRRVIFLSTSKVLGEESVPGLPFDDETPAAPQGAYAVSKHEAETTLENLARELSLEYVTLRPPLIYGAGVKANFLALAKAIARGLPIPVPSVANRRTFLSVDNLARAIVACLRKDALPNRPFLITDGSSLSTEELITALGKIFGKRPTIVRIPAGLSGVFLATPILKKKWSRLSGSFEIEATDLPRWLTEWRPVSTELGLRRVFGREKG